MTSDSQGNRRIARNTFYLYLRKIFTLGVGLYTSRALLHYLGVDDYGLYGVVGSVIVLFGSLRILFATSIQRFINVEIGRGNTDRVNVVFSMGVKIQAFIAALFIVVIEIAAFFLLPTLNIAPEKLSVAWAILQFSMLTAVVSMMTVPFDGLIISSEKIKVYVIFASIESVLKLFAVLALALSPIPPVIFYAFLLFVVSILMRIGLAVYCRHAFGDLARFRNVKDKQLMREMSGFAGWQFVGEMGYTVSQAGVNFLLNIFGGVGANAAKAVASQVMGVTVTLADDLNLSFSPQIVSNYSRSDYSRYRQLSYFCFKCNFLAVVILCFPVYIMAPSLLRLWLETVPPSTISFLKGMLLFSIFLPFEYTFNIIMKANGNIRKFQIIKAFANLSNIPVGWIALFFGAPLYAVFYIMTIVEIIYLSTLAIVGRREFKLPVKDLLRHVIYPIMRCVVIFVILIVLARRYLAVSDLSAINTIAYTVVIFIVGVFISTATILSAEQRKRLNSLILSKLHLKH